MSDSSYVAQRRMPSPRPRGLGEAISGKKPPSDTEIMAMYIARLSNITAIDPGSLTLMMSTNPDKFAEVAHNAGLEPPPLSMTPVPPTANPPDVTKPKEPTPAPAAAAPAPPAGLYPSAANTTGPTETPEKVAADLSGSEGTDVPTGGEGDTSKDDLTKGAGPTKSEIGEALLAGLTGIKRPVQPPNPPAVAPQGPTTLRTDDSLAGVPLPDVARRRSLKEAIG